MLVQSQSSDVSVGGCTRLSGLRLTNFVDLDHLWRRDGFFLSDGGVDVESSTPVHLETEVGGALLFFEGVYMGIHVEFILGLWVVQTLCDSGGKLAQYVECVLIFLPYFLGSQTLMAFYKRVMKLREVRPCGRQVAVSTEMEDRTTRKSGKIVDWELGAIRHCPWPFKRVILGVDYLRIGIFCLSKRKTQGRILKSR